jgi:hypothetical protein
MATFIPDSVATLANEFAIRDLELFFFTLELWNEKLPTVYLYCNSKVNEWLKKEKRYKGTLVVK